MSESTGSPLSGWTINPQADVELKGIATEALAVAADYRVRLDQSKRTSKRQGKALRKAQNQVRRQGNRINVLKQERAEMLAAMYRLVITDDADDRLDVVKPFDPDEDPTRTETVCSRCAGLGIDGSCPGCGAWP